MSQNVEYEALLKAILQAKQKTPQAGHISLPILPPQASLEKLREELEAMIPDVQERAKELESKLVEVAGQLDIKPVTLASIKGDKKRKRAPSQEGDNGVQLKQSLSVTDYGLDYNPTTNNIKITIPKSSLILPADVKEQFEPVQRSNSAQPNLVVPKPATAAKKQVANKSKVAKLKAGGQAKRVEQNPVSEVQIADFDRALTSGQLRNMTVLGGIPVDGDYSKLPRATNQTPIDQFWRFCEQYFRNITDEDLRWLDNRGDEFTPYLIPQLGKHYTQIWEEESKGIAATQKSVNSKPGSVPSDVNVETDDIVPSLPQLEPLAERILSALMHDDLIDTNALESEEEEQTPVKQRGKHPTVHPVKVAEDVDAGPKTKEEMLEIEDRVRNELLSLGLAAPEDIEILHQTVQEQAKRAMESGTAGYYHPGDDEVSKELIRLQDQLRAQVEVVYRLKQMVKKYAVAWAAWQEWWNVKDMIEKWIEDFYNKKFRNPKKKKSKEKQTIANPNLPPIPAFFLPPGNNQANSQQTLNNLIERRRYWIDVVGKAVVASAAPENQPEDVPAQHFAPGDEGQDLTAPTTGAIASHEARNPLGGGPHENGLRGPQVPKKSILDIDNDEELRSMLPKDLYDLWDQARRLRSLEKGHNVTVTYTEESMTPLLRDTSVEPLEVATPRSRSPSVARSASPMEETESQDVDVEMEDVQPQVLPPNTSGRMAPGQANSMAAKKSQSKAKTGGGGGKMTALEDVPGMERIRDIALQRVIARLKGD